MNYDNFQTNVIYVGVNWFVGYKLFDYTTISIENLCYKYISEISVFRKYIFIIVDIIHGYHGMKTFSFR